MNFMLDKKLLVAYGKKGLEKVKDITKSLFAIALALTIVIGGVLLAIKLCMWLALSSEEIMLLEKSVPLLEKIVWPLFILMLVFLFRNEIQKSLSEIPGLISRSYLPYSPVPYQSEKPTRENMLTRSEDVNDDGFDQDDHNMKVKLILELVSREEGVLVRPYVKLLNSNWVCNGAYEVGREVRYMAILPKKLSDRIYNVIYRTNMAIQDYDIKELRIFPVLVVCLYGFESRNEIDNVDVVGFRRLSDCKVVFKFILKEQLEQKGDA